MRDEPIKNQALLILWLTGPAASLCESSRGRQKLVSGCAGPHPALQKPLMSRLSVRPCLWCFTLRKIIEVQTRQFSWIDGAGNKLLFFIFFNFLTRLQTGDGAWLEAEICVWLLVVSESILLLHVEMFFWSHNLLQQILILQHAKEDFETCLWFTLISSFHSSIVVIPKCLFLFYWHLTKLTKVVSLKSECPDFKCVSHCCQWNLRLSLWWKFILVGVHCSRAVRITFSVAWWC